VGAAQHFKLWFLGAVLHVADQLGRNLGSVSEVVEQFPFVADYLDEIERWRGGDAHGDLSTAEWFACVRKWEGTIDAHLPLRALRETLGLDDRALTLLMAIGLIEEDPRFGFLIETAQPGATHRPTLGLLTAWWRDDEGVAGVRGAIRVLLEHGLVQVLNHDAPRLQWMFQSPAAIWDALRGETSLTAMPGVACTAAARLPNLDRLVLPQAVKLAVGAIPSVLRSGDAKALIVRGPRHNGRRTIARAVAAALGRGTLELQVPVRPDDDRWSAAGALATLLHAMPVVALDLGLGETCELPSLKGYDGPIAVVVGKNGAVTGAAVAESVTIPVAMPGPAERYDLWQHALPAPMPERVRELADRFRMASGTIFSSASLGRAHAALDGRSDVTAADVRVAGRALHAEIERLATHIPASGGWECIGAAAETLADLRTLEVRCRNRERLQHHAGPALGHQLNCGVRALFTGPSGTGKTMAARLLAAALEVDLYRLDLASVVNKYIGETEKSLDQLFSRAEELDVVLLIDEGDALLTNRTAVQSSNDRYANLETNYLLQRLESFEGVVIVTTNAANRIDTAFQRRMDVVVEFRMPGPHERWLIWQLHLPLDHGVDPSWLEEAALRCDLSGGQIRNAVLHASLAALERGRTVSTPDLLDAVHREYRKTGTVCPLPRPTPLGV
jgi:hypothetical protein